MKCLWASLAAAFAGVLLLMALLIAAWRPHPTFVISEPELRTAIAAYQDSLEWERKHHTWLEMVCPDTTGSGQ